jgi:hypothetical protein
VWSVSNWRRRFPGYPHASYSTVYIWILEALTIGSLAIFTFSWLLQRIRK